MLKIQNGNCSKCGSVFEPMYTVQSADVECSKCKKKVTVCKSCKDKGCDCGGDYLNTFDKYPNLMH